MDNLDVRTVLPMLQKLGIDPSKLSAEKMERLMKLGDNLNDPSKITPEVVSEITNIFGIELNGKKTKDTVKSGPKIKRNELCPCESGKKWKKCCM